MSAGDVALDPDGKPYAKLQISMAEKIGLPKFSNVDVGPVSLTRWVEDNPESLAAAKEEMLEFVELILSEERLKIIEYAQGGDG